MKKFILLIIASLIVIQAEKIAEDKDNYELVDENETKTSELINDEDTTELRRSGYSAPSYSRTYYTRTYHPSTPTRVIHYNYQYHTYYYTYYYGGGTVSGGGIGGVIVGICILIAVVGILICICAA